ncbi:MAG: hypothetical protein LBF59_05565 [Prevotellaceae bacterium]|jgi:hypothetical protein|nr:hypothetical protein [Prevotellaceae bacterium]
MDKETTYHFTDNVLNNALFQEFLKDNPSEQYIRELVLTFLSVSSEDIRDKHVRNVTHTVIE